MSQLSSIRIYDAWGFRITVKCPCPPPDCVNYTMPTTRAQEAAQRRNDRSQAANDSEKATTQHGPRTKKPASAKKAVSAKSGDHVKQGEGAPVLGNKRGERPEMKSDPAQEPLAKKVKTEEEPSRTELSESYQTGRISLMSLATAMG